MNNFYCEKLINNYKPIVYEDLITKKNYKQIIIQLKKITAVSTRSFHPFQSSYYKPQLNSTDSNIQLKICNQFLDLMR